MIKNTVSIRDHKSARIKLLVLNSTLEIIKKGSFERVHVNKICSMVDISKVTFFKYFRQKEDILLYYLKVWCFHQAVELSLKHRSGLDGIRFLFDKVAKSYESHPGLFLGLFGYFSKKIMPIKPFPLKIAERRMLFSHIENIHEIDVLSLEQLFENFVLEAILNKEITKTGDVKQIVMMLHSILYGTMVTAHLHQKALVSVIFKQNLNLFLDSLHDNHSPVESMTGG